MTEEDIKFRQGRSKRQVESNFKAFVWALVGLGIALFISILIT